MKNTVRRVVSAAAKTGNRVTNEATVACILKKAPHVNTNQTVILATALKQPGDEAETSEGFQGFNPRFLLWQWHNVQISQHFGGNTALGKVLFFITGNERQRAVIGKWF